MPGRHGVQQLGGREDRDESDALEEGEHGGEFGEPQC